MERSTFFTQFRLLYLSLMFAAGVVGACNYSRSSPKPLSTSLQPIPEIPALSTAVVPEVSASPSADLSSTPSPKNTLSEDPSICHDDMKILATFGGVEGNQAEILIAWPGAVIELSWRIQNNGVCIWDSAYSFEQVNTEQVATDVMDTVKESLSDQVAPGKSIMVKFKVSVPLAPGDYPVSWVLINGYRKTVGQPLKTILRVPGGSSNQPLPTMTRNPNVQFEASSTQVAPHDRVALTWDVKQAIKVYFYTTGQAWVPNQVSLKGERIYFPTIDTAYNLRVVNYDNTVESYKIEVMVEPPLGLPKIVLFELDPKGLMILGSCVDISWRVHGGLATEISLFANHVLLISNADRIATFSDCPTQVGLIVYTLTASGPGGTASKSKVIDVTP
jgi:hypothetical protein